MVHDRDLSLTPGRLPNRHITTTGPVAERVYIPWNHRAWLPSFRLAGARAELDDWPNRFPLQEIQGCFRQRRLSAP